MGWLRDVRAGVKTALTSETQAWNTWDYNPEAITAPAIALTYGSPLMEDGPNPTFGTSQVRLVVTLIPEVGMNETVTEALDGLIEISVTRLLDAGYGVEQVGQPYMLEASNARYLSVDLTITADVTPQPIGD